MTGADRLPVDETAPAPEPAVRDGAEPPADSGDADPARFPLAPFGYNRTAVDEHLAGLERELEELRSKHAPMASITDELERIGEQTASILVVAHDQANETTRLAQEQAERCVADAAANAVQMTADAKAKLSDLDAETDAVWRERERLLEDVRVVSAALTNLADQASERFPPACRARAPPRARLRRWRRPRTASGSSSSRPSSRRLPSQRPGRPRWPSHRPLSRSTCSRTAATRRAPRPGRATRAAGSRGSSRPTFRPTAELGERGAPPRDLVR